MECNCCVDVTVQTVQEVNIEANCLQLIPMSITDATAEPEDVRLNKVFYNNDGKQVGTLNINLDIMQAIDLQNINYNGGYTMASETDYENALPIFQYWANIIMNGGSYNV